MFGFQYRTGMPKMLLHEHGIDISHESVDFDGTDLGRCLPPTYAGTASEISAHIPIGNGSWMRFLMKINGEKRYLWRAVDHEGEVHLTDGPLSY